MGKGNHGSLQVLGAGAQFGKAAGIIWDKSREIRGCGMQMEFFIPCKEFSVLFHSGNERREREQGGRVGREGMGRMEGREEEGKGGGRKRRGKEKAMNKQTK